MHIVITPLKYPFWNKGHVSSGSSPLPSLLAPTREVLKGHLSFRTPHTSIDTVSWLYIFFCPLCFLPFIPWILIPRAFFTKSPACYTSSQSASWASQPRTKHFLEITTSHRGSRKEATAIYMCDSDVLTQVWSFHNFPRKK